MITNTRAITSPMTLKIVRALRRGALRFNAIARAIKAPNHPVLSDRLKKMARDGLIERRVIRLGPPAHVEYALTALGIGLAEAASPLVEWTEHNGDQIKAARQDHAAAFAAQSE